MIKRRKKQPEQISSVPVVLARGVGRALLITAVMMLVVTTLTSLTRLGEGIATWLMLPGCLAAALTGSWYVGLSLGRTGWLFGGVAGGCYAAILLILALFLDIQLSLMTFVALAALTGIGSLGGIFGVNSR